MYLKNKSSNPKLITSWLLKEVRDECDDNTVIIDRSDSGFENGDEVSVIKYPTDGTILHLKVKIVENTEEKNFSYASLNKNNVAKLGCDIEGNTITIYK